MKKKSGTCGVIDCPSKYIKVYQIYYKINNLTVLSNIDKTKSHTMDKEQFTF